MEFTKNFLLQNLTFHQMLNPYWSLLLNRKILSKWRYLIINDPLNWWSFVPHNDDILCFNTRLPQNNITFTSTRSDWLMPRKGNFLLTWLKIQPLEKRKTYSTSIKLKTSLHLDSLSPLPDAPASSSLSASTTFLNSNKAFTKSPPKFERMKIPL